MTRRLPWQTGPSAAPSRPKRPPTSSRATEGQNIKRFRANNSSFEVSTLRETSSSKKAKEESKVRTPSSSPPPGPPEEKFMVEGETNDDRYRMVEDEFLSVARQFTGHIHVAEYKRQQKIAKERNANAIRSISRPVSGKMLDQTHRKIQNETRSATQKKIFRGILSRAGDPKGTDSDESDNNASLPYSRTTLHGLMDSPRRKGASLERLGIGMVATRAAARYNKPSETTPEQRSISKPLPSIAASLDRQQSADYSSIEVSGDDDDLDAPIPAPKRGLLVRRSDNTTFTSILSIDATTATDLESFTASRSFTPMSRKPMDNVAISTSNESRLEQRNLSPGLSSRIAKRLEQRRQQRNALRHAEQKKGKLDNIPTFL